MADLIEKLGEIEDKLASIDKDLGDPEVYSRASELERLGRMRSEIEPVATASAEYRKVLDELGEARELLETESDQELRDMALEEIEVLRERQEQLEEELRILLLPKEQRKSEGSVGKRETVKKNTEKKNMTKFEEARAKIKKKTKKKENKKKNEKRKT